MKRVPKVSELTYQCKHCGFTCIKKKSISSNPEEWGIGRGITKTGDYGSNATPTPTTFSDTVAQYTAATISFTAASGSTPAKINDSDNQLADKGFLPGRTIVVSTESGTNDGTYTLAEYGGVASGSLSLSSSDTLTTEAAATAGEVTVCIRSYQPNITTGCPLCGSLNSR